MVRCTTDDDASCDPFEFEADDEPINHGLPVYEEQNKVPYTKGTVSPPPGSSAAALVNGRYQLGSTIGKGNDGTVVRAMNVLTGKQLAIKITNKNRHSKECGSSESENTCRSQSRNVVKVHEVVDRGDIEYLVMEVAEMDLLELINALGCIDEEVAREYFRDLIHGLDSCHKAKVVHLDVKPDNLLIIDDGSPNGRVKLADFGLSAYIGGQSGPVLLCQACGSNGYAPPEILRGTETYDGHLADIWSSGVVLYACTQGQLPWDDACEECEEFIDYLNGEFTFPSNMSPGLQALLRKILVVEPNNRATLEDIKNDDWFRQGHQGSLSDSFSSEGDDNDIESIHDAINSMAINEQPDQPSPPMTNSSSPSNLPGQWKRS